MVDVADVRAKYKEAKKHQSDWRVEALENYDFVAGHQWRSEDEQKLEEEGRPAITFNRMDPYFDAISGQEINSRQQIQYLPRVPGNVTAHEKLTAAVKWVYDETFGSEEESEAVRDVLICGLGAIETRMDYDEDPDGKVTMERGDPLEYYWDPNAKKKNLRDRKWDLRAQWQDKKYVEEKWGKKIDLPTTNWADDDEQPEAHNASLAFLYRQNADDYDEKAGKVRVLLYRYYELEALYKVRNPDGQLSRLSQKKFDAYSKMTPNLEEGTDYAKLKQRVYKYAFICGDTVLDEGTLRCKNFNVKFITGKRDRNKNVWYGVARGLKDPQLWSNKFFSQILHIINSNAKGGLLAEVGAFEDPRKAEADWADPSKVILLKNGALSSGRIKEREPSAYPQGLDRLMEFAVGALPQVSGVNPEFMGMADREQANILEVQRKKSVFNTLAWVFDSLRQYRVEQGKLLLHYINEYISDGRLIRITTTQGEQYIPLDRSDDAIEYDVVVDQAPWAPNLKEQVWEAMMQIMPTFAKMGMPPPPGLLDYSPLPSKEVAAWKKQIGDPIPPEVKEQMQQMQQQMQQLTQENMQLKAGIGPKMAQIQSKHQLGSQKNQIEAARVLTEQGAVQSQVDMNASTTQMNYLQMLHDGQMQQQQMLLEQQKMMTGLATELIKLQNTKKTKKGADGSTTTEESSAPPIHIHMPDSKPRKVRAKRDPNDGSLLLEET